jgi:hypothetical protein
VQIGQILCAHRSPDSEEEQGGVETGEHGQSGGDEEGEAADHGSTLRPDFGVAASSVPAGVSTVSAAVPAVSAGVSTVSPALSRRCRRQAPGSEKGSSSLSAAGSPKTSRAPRTSPRWTPQTMSGCSWAASSSGHRVSRKLRRSVGASTLGDASSPTGSGANPSSSSRVTVSAAAEIPSGAEELAASPSPGLRLGVGRIYLVAELRLGGRALFGGLPGEVTAPVDSGRDSVFARVRARAVDVCGQHRGQTEVFGGSRPRGARGSIQPGRTAPAGRCGLGLRGRTGLDELVEVLAHGVLVQAGHGRQGRDRHGARLGGEVLAYEGDRRGQIRLRGRRFGPERRRIPGLRGRDCFSRLPL